MILKQIAVGNMDNFNYIIEDEESKEAAVVDPAWEVGKLLEEAEKEGLKITKIILTHTHFDHTDGVQEIAEKTGAEVYVHSKESGDINTSTKINRVEDGDTIQVGKISIKVIHTPGHTPGGMCLLFEKKLITGDTLFVEGCGRIDLPGSDANQMWESLQKIKALDDDVEVYPGHDYGSKKHSTIAHEKKHNRFLHSETKEEFLGFRLH